MCLFGQGEKEICDGECADFQYQYVEEIEDICVYQYDDDCYIVFNFQQTLGDNVTVLVLKEKREWLIHDSCEWFHTFL